MSVADAYERTLRAGSARIELYSRTAPAHSRTRSTPRTSAACAGSVRSRWEALELWDFGAVDVDALDWTVLPTFRGGDD